MVVDPAADAAAAGSAKEWATSSTAASVAVVGAAVSPDNIAGLFVSVPVMAASSLPFLLGKGMEKPGPHHGDYFDETLISQVHLH